MAQNRRMEILRVVVEDYIRTQEPISSSSVTSRHKIGVSPATVRHEMAQLEEEGYLMQPHTSAGRIPSEKGYRYFGDQLSSLIPLSAVPRISCKGPSAWTTPFIVRPASWPRSPAKSPSWPPPRSYAPG